MEQGKGTAGKVETEESETTDIRTQLVSHNGVWGLLNG